MQLKREPVADETHYEDDEIQSHQYPFPQVGERVSLDSADVFFFCHTVAIVTVDTWRCHVGSRLRHHAWWRKQWCHSAKSITLFIKSQLACLTVGNFLHNFLIKYTKDVFAFVARLQSELNCLQPLHSQLTPAHQSSGIRTIIYIKYYIDWGRWQMTISLGVAVAISLLQQATLLRKLSSARPFSRCCGPTRKRKSCAKVFSFVGYTTHNDN